MTQPYPNALPIARKVLRVLVALNLVVGALILALLVASLVAPTWVMTALGVAPADRGWPLGFGMRLIMVGGIVAVPLTHRVLTRLQAIVETVREGDPFVAANAVRLQSIAWLVLGLEAMRMATMTIAAAVSTQSTPIDIEWRIDVTGLVTVVLLFVLAGVFEHGTRMRDDLEGTV